MNDQSKRIQEILDSMDGPERGKKSRLATLAECTRALIGQWMTVPGQTINYEHAKNIEIALGFRAGWIIDGTGPKKPGARNLELAPPVDRNKVDAEDIAKLVTLFAQSTNEGRERIMTAAKMSEKISPSRGNASANDQF